MNRGTESRTFICPQRAAIAPLINVASHEPGQNASDCPKTLNAQVRRGAPKIKTKGARPLTPDPLASNGTGDAHGALPSTRVSIVKYRRDDPHAHDRTVGALLLHDLALIEVVMRAACLFHSNA